MRHFLWCAVAVTGGVMGGILYAQMSINSSLSQVVTTQTGDTIGGDFEVVSHTGEIVTETNLIGSPSVMFFGFTQCPEICPTTLSDIDGWLDALGDEGADIKGYFVTVDPERDTEEVLSEYVSSFSDRITGLTGPKENIAKLLNNYRIYSNKVQLGDGEYTMDHTASVILLDRNGEFVSTISYGETLELAVSKLKLLISREQGV